MGADCQCCAPFFLTYINGLRYHFSSLSLVSVSFILLLLLKILKLSGIAKNSSLLPVCVRTYCLGSFILSYKIATCKLVIGFA